MTRSVETAAIMSMAGTLRMAPASVPDASCRVIGERRACKLVGDRDAKVVEEADNIARPADGDRGGAKCIFEDQVPADDPGDELAHGRIGIGVGTAGDRDGRGHLRVAETGKGAGDAAKTKESAIAGPALVAAAWPVSTKMPAPMMQPIPREIEAPRRKRALQGHAAMGYQGLDLGLLGFGLEYGHRFSDQDILHLPSPSCSCLRRMVQLSAANNQAVSMFRNCARTPCSRETLLVRWPSTTMARQIRLQRKFRV